MQIPQLVSEYKMSYELLGFGHWDHPNLSNIDVRSRAHLRMVEGSTTAVTVAEDSIQ